MWKISPCKEFDTVISKQEEKSCIVTAGKGFSNLTYNTHYAYHCRCLKWSKSAGKYILIWEMQMCKDHKVLLTIL